MVKACSQLQKISDETISRHSVYAMPSRNVTYFCCILITAYQSLFTGKPESSPKGSITSADSEYLPVGLLHNQSWKSPKGRNLGAYPSDGPEHSSGLLLPKDTQMAMVLWYLTERQVLCKTSSNTQLPAHAAYLCIHTVSEKVILLALLPKTCPDSY